MKQKTCKTKKKKKTSREKEKKKIDHEMRVPQGNNPRVTFIHENNNISRENAKLKTEHLTVGGRVVRYINSKHRK